MVAGGEFAEGVSWWQSFRGVSASTEVYDPGAGQFSAGPDMTSPRSGHTATLLADGRVLITGGYTSFSPFGLTGTAELFVPANWPAAAASAVVSAKNLRGASPGRSILLVTTNLADHTKVIQTRPIGEGVRWSAMSALRLH